MLGEYCGTSTPIPDRNLGSIVCKNLTIGLLNGVKGAFDCRPFLTVDSECSGSISSSLNHAPGKVGRDVVGGVSSEIVVRTGFAVEVSESGNGELKGRIISGSVRAGDGGRIS